MATKRKLKTINKFYGGIVRDDKSRVIGGALNMEELDIFSNVDYFQAEQIFTADSLPASTEVFAFDADNTDQVWAYGKQTSDSAVRLLKVTSAGDTNPGAFSTVFTSADTTDICYSVSPIRYHRRDDGNQNFLYYCTNASGTVKLKSFDITGGTESEQDSASTNMTLDGLTGSYDRISMKTMFGELFITNGQYIAKVDDDGVFTNHAFTLPNGWVAVDIIPVSDVCIILARSINRKSNKAAGFWWDLTTTSQVDDSFDIPFGGPQWIVNHKENIRILCAQNGTAKVYQLSGAFPGAVPIEIPGLLISNVATETATQPISLPKMVSTKDNILYFALWKTDKTGVYAIGQLDTDKPNAYLLAKRFHTSNYANHKPWALHIQGPNYFGAFDDNGTNGAVRCESLNSPDRSDNAIYESIIIDDGDPTTNKTAAGAFVTTRPLPASSDVDFYIGSDYGTLAEIFREDGTSLTTTDAVLGWYKPKGINKKKVYQLKVQLTSAGANSPKVTSLNLLLDVEEVSGPA